MGKDTNRQKSQGSNYGYLKLPSGVNVFKEEPGRVHIDILPYLVTMDKHPDRDDDWQIAIPGELWYKLPFKTHRNIGAANDTVVCPRSFGKRCPICEAREKMIKEGASKEVTDPLRPSQRNLYAIMVKTKKDGEKIMVWDISHYLFQKLLNEELEENPQFNNFPDHEDGYTLKVRFEEQAIGKNKFSEATRIDFEERPEQFDDSILKHIPNLDEMLTIKSYKELEALFLELDAPDTAATEDDSIEEEPVVNFRKRKDAGGQRKPAPVEDEDDEDEGDEDEDEAPPVNRSNKKDPPAPIRRKPAPVEDEDDEDEDDTPPPSKPSKKSADAPIRRRPAPVEDDEDEDAAPPIKKGKSTGDANKCPFGHKFGHDCEKHKDCDSCDVWEDCLDEQARLGK